ncbi:MAG: hypothetical protein AAF961_01835, partial [Planctomycetota bacterium]
MKRFDLDPSAGQQAGPRITPTPVIAVLLTALAAAELRGADPSGQVVAALRDRGWNDTAVEYIDWLEGTPLASPRFRARAAYERAAAQATLAQQEGNRRLRSELRRSAAEEFVSYAEQRPQDPAAVEALRDAANLFAERGLSKAADAERLPRTAEAQRDQILAAARESFEEAKKAAEQLNQLARIQLSKLPKAALIQSDPEAKALRDRLRSRAAEALYLRALVDFEAAETHPRDSGDWRNALETARSRFRQLSHEYSDSLVGASSRFYEGRCHQELGEFEKAVRSFEYLIVKPVAHAEFRRWTARAHRRRAECLMSLGQPEKAIRACEDWLAQSRQDERSRAEWLAVSYQLAQAYLAKSDASSESAGEERRLISQARLLLRDVADQGGEFQQQARVSLASFRQAPSSEDPPESFEEALAAGKTSLEVMNSAKLAMRLARENNPAAVEELEQQAAQGQREALRLLQTALRLADDESSTDDLNAVRYYLCWLYWEEGRLHDAAVLGRYLATRFPDSQYARGAAKVALAACEKL